MGSDFATEYREECGRRLDAYLAAEAAQLIERTPESERRALDAHEAYMKYVALDGVDPPEGWVFIKPNE